jgi:PAS domain S-box-containing protein
VDLLQSVIDGMPGLVSLIDREYRYRFVNEGYAKWFRRPASDFVGQPIADVLGADSLEAIRPYLERAFAGETVTFERSIAYSDATREVRATYVPRAEGVVVLVQDITESKRTEQQFRTLVEVSSEGIWTVEKDGRTTFVNQRMADILGYTCEEMIGRTCLEHIHPEDLERARAGVAKRLSGDRNAREYRMIRKDGSIVWVDFTGNRLTDAQGNTTGLLAMCTDVTERRRAQEQMQQSQKLESLGVLAGGVAHDFNNLLVGIMGNASLAAEMVGEESPAAPLLTEVLRAGERAAQLTRRMLAYAGRTERAVQPVDVNTLVSSMAPLLQASMPKTVLLRLELPEGVGAVAADEGQLQQVVINLAINAAEAIPKTGSGVVTIATALRRLTAEERQRSVIPLAAPEAEHVVLSVTDNGVGMDAATRARIFDPFFTTKFAGRGLGLSAVLGIMKAHQGSLAIESRPGRGTTFEVLLPAADRGAALASGE